MTLVLRESLVRSKCSDHVREYLYVYNCTLLRVMFIISKIGLYDIVLRPHIRFQGLHISSNAPVFIMTSYLVRVLLGCPVLSEIDFVWISFVYVLSLSTILCTPVRLGNPYIINCIRLLLWDRDQRSYSYYIEVSLDGHSWITVVDYSHYLCRSWQEVFFTPHCIRYTTLCGMFRS